MITWIKVVQRNGQGRGRKIAPELDNTSEFASCSPSFFSVCFFSGWRDASDFHGSSRVHSWVIRKSRRYIIPLPSTLNSFPYPIFLQAQNHFSTNNSVQKIWNVSPLYDVSKISDFIIHLLLPPLHNLFSVKCCTHTHLTYFGHLTCPMDSKRHKKTHL